MSTPAWQLRPPVWQLTGRAEYRPPPIKRRPTIYRTVPPSPELVERATVEGGTTLNMRFALFGVWTEIDNAREGHFLERISRGAFAKTIRENLRSVRAILSHGKDPSLGSTVLGKIRSIREEPDAAIATVDLFGGLPQLLRDGLEAGQYGSSWRGDAIKSSVDWHPERSPHNPQAIPEVTRTEIRLKDVGPTPFAAYADTTAEITSGGPPTRARQGDKQLVRAYWQLGEEPRPYWSLERKERRGHTYSKA
jgi:phage head maturation protease